MRQYIALILTVLLLLPSVGASDDIVFPSVMLGMDGYEVEHEMRYPRPIIALLYWSEVNQNESLKPFLEFARTIPHSHVTDDCTRDTPEIRAVAKGIWKNDTIVYPDGERITSIRSNDPIADYVKNSILYVSGTIEPSYDNWTVVKYQIPADVVLRDRIGMCDEIVALFCSLMKVKGIPCEPKAVWHGTETTSHAQAKVYVSGGWLKVDPTYRIFGSWSVDEKVPNDRRFKDITETRWKYWIGC